MTAADYDDGGASLLGYAAILIGIAAVVVVGIVAVGPLLAGSIAVDDPVQQVVEADWLDWAEVETDISVSRNVALASRYKPGNAYDVPGLPRVKINPDEYPYSKKRTAEEVDKVRDCIFRKGAEYILTTRLPDRFVLLCREDPNQDAGWLLMVIQKIEGIWTEINSYPVAAKYAVTIKQIFDYCLAKDGTTSFLPGPPWVLP